MMIDLQLECNTLESTRTSLHDLLACSNGTSEGDLGNVWVHGKHRAELIVATHDLNNSRWKDFLSKLNGLESGVRGVWASSRN